jgi:hypothetical protein
MTLTDRGGNEQVRRPAPHRRFDPLVQVYFNKVYLNE